MATVRRLIGNIKGPKGDTGATGATGAQGPAGQDGAPGVSDYATTEAAGLVRVGDDFKINSSNGTLSIKNLFTTASTLAKMVSEEAFATSLGKIAKAVDWVVDNAPNFFNKSTDIVDGFNSALTDKALSANAGKTLKTQLDSLNDSLDGVGGSYAAFTSNDDVTINDKTLIGTFTMPTGTWVVETFVRLHNIPANSKYSLYLGTLSTTALASNSSGQTSFFVGNASSGYFGTSFIRIFRITSETQLNLIVQASGGACDVARVMRYKIAN